MQGNAANLAFKGLSSALNTYDNRIVSSPEIRLFEGSAYEVAVVRNNNFKQVVTGIDFELFFDGFETFWKEVEELVYLVEGASEKEGVVGLKGHLWGHWGDEFAIAVDFSEEEVVEVT